MPIKAIEVHRALKVVLGINYRYRWLDAYISPERTEWYAAIQFRNDPERRWTPRVMYFYPEVQNLAILGKIGDDPIWLSAQIILEMAKAKGKAPLPQV